MYKIDMIKNTTKPGLSSPDEWLMGERGGGREGEKSAREGERVINWMTDNVDRGWAALRLNRTDQNRWICVWSTAWSSWLTEY